MVDERHHRRIVALDADGPTSFVREELPESVEHYLELQNIDVVPYEVGISDTEAWCGGREAPCKQ